MRSAWPGCERAQSQGGWQSGVVSQGGSRLVWPCSQAVSSVSSTQKVPTAVSGSPTFPPLSWGRCLAEHPIQTDTREGG